MPSMRMNRRILLSFAFSLAVVASAASVDGINIHSTVRGSGPKTVVFVHGVDL